MFLSLPPSPPSSFPASFLPSRASLSSICLFFTLPPRSLHQRAAEASGRSGVRRRSHTTADDITDFGSPIRRPVCVLHTCVCVCFVDCRGARRRLLVAGADGVRVGGPCPDLYTLADHIGLTKHNGNLPSSTLDCY